MTEQVPALSRFPSMPPYSHNADTLHNIHKLNVQVYGDAVASTNIKHHQVYLQVPGRQVDTCTCNCLRSEPDKDVGTEAVVHVVPGLHSDDTYRQLDTATAPLSSQHHTSIIVQYCNHVTVINTASLV